MYQGVAFARCLALQSKDPFIISEVLCRFMSSKGCGTLTLEAGSVQVADMCIHMGTRERSHHLQLAEVLQDAAAHEAAAVESAIAATLAAMQQNKG